ncbi:MAG: hypothetical protein EBR01_14310 [Proteobacteria bacterium]|nr:hypothetical protein [Pseudomonadota bacterium]
MAHPNNFFQKFLEISYRAGYQEGKQGKILATMTPTLGLTGIRKPLLYPFELWDPVLGKV